MIWKASEGLHIYLLCTRENFAPASGAQYSRPKAEENVGMAGIVEDIVNCRHLFLRTSTAHPHEFAMEWCSM